MNTSGLLPDHLKFASAEPAKGTAKCGCYVHAGFHPDAEYRNEWVSRSAGHLLYDLHVIYQIIVQTFLYMILMLLTASVPSVGHIANALRTYSLVLRREVYLSRAGATSPVGPVLTGHFWPHPMTSCVRGSYSTGPLQIWWRRPCFGITTYSRASKVTAINFKASI